MLHIACIMFSNLKQLSKSILTSLWSTGDIAESDDDDNYNDINSNGNNAIIII